MTQYAGIINAGPYRVTWRVLGSGEKRRPHAVLTPVKPASNHQTTPGRVSLTIRGAA